MPPDPADPPQALPATSSCACGPEAAAPGGAAGAADAWAAGELLQPGGGEQEEPACKPYLGGYRNIRTGQLHHHAATQTPLPRRPQRSLVCSEAQTACEQAHSTQTRADAGTQCPRPGWYEDTSADRVLLPTAHHETAAQLLERKAAAATTIQRHLRGWLARQRAAIMRNAKLALEEFAAAQEAQRAQQEEEHRAAEIKRRMQPRTAADFEVLYGELAAWWSQEAARIKAADTDEETKQQALQQLLAKETKLLQTIDKLKIVAAGPNRASRVESTLQRMAAPKRWLANGTVLEVQTPGTGRAAELADVYRSLVAADGSNIDARLSALMQVRGVVEGCDPHLAAAKELLQLIDREADLLNRGRSPVEMAGLRLRIANCFYQLLKTPGFNAEALQQGVALKSQQYKFTRRNQEYGMVKREAMGTQTA